MTNEKTDDDLFDDSQAKRKRLLRFCVKHKKWAGGKFIENVYIIYYLFE